MPTQRPRARSSPPPAWWPGRHGSGRIRRRRRRPSRPISVAPPSRSTRRPSPASVAASARAVRSVAISCASTCAPERRRSLCSRVARSSSTTCRSRPTTPTQIHGNIYLGRVQNVLPGMEAAFVDIGTPKNAVLYRGDLQYDQEDIVEKGANAAHRADPEGPPDDRLPGHEEPDRRQGRAAHSGGVAARALRRADPELEHLRHLEASERRRAQAAARHPRPRQAGTARRDRAHRGRGHQHRRDRAGRRPARLPVGADRGARQALVCARAPLHRAEHGGAGHPRGVQPRVPRRGHRRPRALRGGPRLRREHQPRLSPTGSSTTTPWPKASLSSSATTCTSSCTRRSTARSGCPRVGRSSSSTPRPSRSST